jgi:hypothetical protein
MRYLEVKFSDTDFGMDLFNAVKQIWDWVTSDYDSHSHESNKRSVVNSFIILYQENRLEPMIRKMVLLNALGHDVEWCTRGLRKDDDFRMHDRIEDVTAGAPHLQEYFSDLEVAFHNTKKFTKEWQNSEHLWFDLETGEGNTF